MTDDRTARQAALIAEFGTPEPISTQDALDAAREARIPPAGGGMYPSKDSWIHAMIYRDNAAWEGWLAANTEHYGHTELLRVPLGDGRVIGVLSLNMEDV